MGPSFFSQGPVSVLYHAVMPETPGWLSGLYSARNPMQFEKELDTLCKNLCPVHVDDLGKYTGRKRPLLITFDDGLRCFQEYAWPILKRKGIPVILFLNPPFIERKGIMFRYIASTVLNMMSHKMTESPLNIAYKDRNVLYQWDRDFLDGAAEAYCHSQNIYLNLEEVKKLSQEGVVMGAHSMDHPDFRQINHQEACLQVSDSLDWIWTHIHEPRRLFAFPFTDDGMSIEFMGWLSAQVDMSFGTAGFKKDYFSNHIHRVPIEKSPKNAWYSVKNEINLYLLKQLLGKHRPTRPS